MNNLSIEQVLYLLYARAYQDDDGTVTKGTIKSYLPKEYKSNAEKIYDSLENKGLVTFARRQRLAVTSLGYRSLVENLGNTEYKFQTNKGAKVTNELLLCIKKALDLTNESPDVSFDEFEDLFKNAYFIERKKQAESGVAIVRKTEILGILKKETRLSNELVLEYFDKLKSKGKISVSQGRNDELIEWVE